MSIPLDVRDLVGQPGATRHVRVDEPVEGLRTELARVPEDTALDADLLLESVVEGILASGEVSGTYALTCARCLAPIEQPFRLVVQELFAADALPADADGYPIADGQIDLEPMIRDAVVLAMPYAPLCKADCLGICERCGGDRNEGGCMCAPEVDERWAPLAGLVLPDDAADPFAN